jgi:sorbitol-specific phosphotransferase system component IIA
MKRLLLVVVITLATTFAAAAKADLISYALSQELLAYMAAAPSSDDLAVGEAKFMKTNMGQSAQVTLAAHGNPLDASGNVRISFSPDLEGRGTVNCIFVSGNQARLSGPLKEPIVIPNFGTVDHFHITATDNGEPNGTNPPDEAFVVLFRTTTPPVSCTQALVPPDPITQGNIVIKDRP